MKGHRPPASYAHARPLHVLVLEDNAELRQQILLPGLRDYGFRVHGAGTAAELHRIMSKQHLDIVILDVGLPDDNGFNVAQRLRSLSDIGIVMLTGNDGRQHHLAALQNGADFYLTKPVDLDVLAATLHNLARRLSPASLIRDAMPDATQPPRWRLEAGCWRFVSPKGKVLALTAAEQCVAATLAAENGTPVSRDSLIQALALKVHNFDPHRLEMMIHRWRRKAISSTGEALPLITLRGNGYMLACDSDTSIPRI
ncbi:response regulator transcription factor [Dyella mobilis]|uniref:Response regulator transcription factor n=2 Tax=Dyella mobilis TaxID=1849582 RepID=A0ABS2KMH9_9GAMM|nr:response regulator transcription factor [Dyella mobilis]